MRKRQAVPRSGPGRDGRPTRRRDEGRPDRCRRTLRCPPRTCQATREPVAASGARIADRAVARRLPRTRAGNAAALFLTIALAPPAARPVRRRRPRRSGPALERAARGHRDHEGLGLPAGSGRPRPGRDRPPPRRQRRPRHPRAWWIGEARPLMTWRRTVSPGTRSTRIPQEDPVLHGSTVDLARSARRTRPGSAESPVADRRRSRRCSQCDARGQRTCQRFRAGHPTQSTGDRSMGDPGTALGDGLARSRPDTCDRRATPHMCGDIDPKGVPSVTGVTSVESPSLPGPDRGTAWRFRIRPPLPSRPRRANATVPASGSRA